MATTEQASRTAEEVARGYFEAIGARDVDAAVAHWSPEGIDEAVGIGVFRGTEEIRGFLAGLIGAVPDLETTVTRVTASDAAAVVEWRMAGTFSGGPLQGVEPTGSHIELRGADCLEVEEGKIVRNTAYSDGTAFARAVGMLPRKDSSAEHAFLAAFNGAVKLRSIIREQLDR
jgi:steroid delta-isomerase-like uncharacterized protein